MSRFRALPSSFKYAANGFKTAFRNEPNFRIHIFIGTMALLLGAFLGLSASEWITLLFTISFVLILEFWNTALEAIVNLVSPELHPKAKIAKDVSAAAVLLGAIVSIIIGMILFLPKLFVF